MTALTDFARPTTEEEVWRYSRIADLDLDAYEPVDDTPEYGPTPAAIEGALATVPVRGVTIVTVNGQMVHLDVAAPGIDVVTDDGEALGIAMNEPTDVFAEMNTE